MFSSLVGLGDNCKIYKRSQFTNDSLKGLLSFCIQEETPYILLESHLINYIFTDLGKFTQCYLFAPWSTQDILNSFSHHFEALIITKRNHGRIPAGLSRGTFHQQDTVGAVRFMRPCSNPTAYGLYGRCRVQIQNEGTFGS